MSDSQDDSSDQRAPSVSASFPAVTDASGLETEATGNGVFVVLTQAFDGAGNNLVLDDGPTFDGFPGVTVWVDADSVSGPVTLSPIHGDTRKSGLDNLDAGTVCVVRGRRDGPVLDAEDACACGRGTYHCIYLSPRLRRGEVALICNIWGCHRSRIIDDSELLSWVDY